jgi:branched-chain amino acid transport system substrate-binding protein
MACQKRFLAASCAALISALISATAAADASGVKIGVMNDMSGTYADLSGKGSVVAAEMAVEEFGGTVLGKPVTVVFGDHQNKADIASTLSRKWFDTDGVDMAIDFPNSSTALAVQDIGKQKNKITIVSTGATTALTGKSCTPISFHWTYDTYSNSYPLAQQLIKNGKDTWTYITVDYAFGHALEADFRKAVEASGGKNVGSTRHPLNASDFSSPILAAQATKAKVVVLANAGNDMINGVKAAGEFGLTKAGQTVIIPVTFITDIKSLGLKAAQGLSYVDAYNLELDDKARAFAKKFLERQKTAPSMGHIGVYSGVLHYLKAVKAANSIDAMAVADKMRAMPVNDAFVHNGKIRADGRMIHDMYVVQVKSESESKGPWDLVKVVGTIPADHAFRPLAESECALVKK